MVNANTILPSHGGRAVDPGHLEMLGKQASRLAETSGQSLNDSVVQAISHEKLGQEHVRRVVEFANIDAFNRKFASMSGPMRAVHVDGGPADPVHVLQSLNNDARPQDVCIKTSEYLSPPTPRSSVDGVLSLPCDRTKKGTLMEIHNLHSKLSAAHESLIADEEAALFMMNNALVDSVQKAKTAKLHGASGNDVLAAWMRVDSELAKVAFDRVDMPLQKHASSERRINPEHPVVRSFEEFAKSAHSYAHNREARRALEGDLVRVGDWLTENGD